MLDCRESFGSPERSSQKSLLKSSLSLDNEPFVWKKCTQKFESSERFDQIPAVIL